MDTLWWQRKYKEIKDFLFKAMNKEFLVFLFFLAISSTFWVITCLNQTYEREYEVPLKITGVPDNVIITEGLPDTIRVTLRDKGFSLLNLSMDEDLSVELPFAVYAKEKGRGGITPNDIQKILRRQIPETTTIQSIKAESWEFFYNYGEKKKVPVVLDADITAKQNYIVTSRSLTPDSVEVYASAKALDTISAVYTENLRLAGVDHDVKCDVRILAQRGTKIIPQKTTLSLSADQLTEKIVSVPVKAVNVPQGVALKTFPATVDVRVAVVVGNSNRISAADFLVEVDYNSLSSEMADKLPVKLTSQPRNIVKATLKTTMVDYIIEK